jgi:acyl-coenzyme A thioesterase PaaI-like protein
MTPEAFAQKINEWARGTMIENHGARFLSAGEGGARSQLTFKPPLMQLTGLFQAGAIIALADETTTAAAIGETNPTGKLHPGLFPLTL